MAWYSMVWYIVWYGTNFEFISPILLLESRHSKNDNTLKVGLLTLTKTASEHVFKSDMDDALKTENEEMIIHRWRKIVPTSNSNFVSSITSTFITVIYSVFLIR